MNSKLVIIGAAVAITAAVPSGAVAAQPTAQPLAGATISCGDRVLTFTAGVQVGDLHRIHIGNERQVVINNVVLHDATLVDEAGARYRAVGGANSTARVVSEGDPEGVGGHFNVNITVLGDDGRVGKILLRERVDPDGTITSITGGGCSL